MTRKTFWHVFMDTEEKNAFEINQILKKIVESIFDNGPRSVAILKISMVTAVSLV